MIKKPVIGITGPDKGGLSSFIFISIAILLSGGVPKWISPLKNNKIGRLDGLVIGGGADIDPKLYEKDSFKNSIMVKASDIPSKTKQRLFVFILIQLVVILRRIFSNKKNIKIDKKRDELEFKMLFYAFLCF